MIDEGLTFRGGGGSEVGEVGGGDGLVESLEEFSEVLGGGVEFAGGFRVVLDAEGLAIGGGGGGIVGVFESGDDLVKGQESLVEVAGHLTAGGEGLFQLGGERVEVGGLLFEGSDDGLAFLLDKGGQGFGGFAEAVGGV
ncbi:MAG: hypothetical protein RI897_4123 [Verrucomicrobiota bacterium]